MYTGANAGGHMTKGNFYIYMHFFLIYSIWREGCADGLSHIGQESGRICTTGVVFPPLNYLAFW